MDLQGNISLLCHLLTYLIAQSLYLTYQQDKYERTRFKYRTRQDLARMSEDGVKPYWKSSERFPDGIPVWKEGEIHTHTNTDSHKRMYTHAYTHTTITHIHTHT